MDKELVKDDRIPSRGLLTVSDEAWEVAVKRAAVIGPLVESGVGGYAVELAAQTLGISRGRVYYLIRLWRDGQGMVSDLVPGVSSGGRGGTRLPDAVETTIREAIRKHYLTRQRKSLAAVYREITRECRVRGFSVPSRGAVERRVAALNPRTETVSREGKEAARQLQSAGAGVPAIVHVLEQVQIDHTVVDLIVVDEQLRLPIGRPFVTIAIDVHSRSIVGLVLTLEAPSALSVGLCLSHIVTDKRVSLERLGVEVDWPMSGKPRELYLDNASEFKSEALRRGCQEHGISLNYRPPGRPHYGGIVERVIGTLMEMVHELPGTTFSNPMQRGSYDSDSRAVLTLSELEQWLTLAVAHYHGQVHGTTLQTPQALWLAGVKDVAPPLVTDATAFLIDFLPVVRRKITRTGFVIDHVRYFQNGLKPWIARRSQMEQFVIRRDPRDISRIWVLDPDDGSYLSVPYSNLSHPVVSVWEHRAALERLKAEGRNQVDEGALFRMVESMREITETARKNTRKARRDSERRKHSESNDEAEILKTPSGIDTLPDDDCSNPATEHPVMPFEEIEQW